MDCGPKSPDACVCVSVCLQACARSSVLCVCETTSVRAVWIIRTMVLLKSQYMNVGASERQMMGGVNFSVNSEIPHNLLDMLLYKC